MSSAIFCAGETTLSGLSLLEASAGTGKTYALERIVADMVAGPAPVDIEHILVVTFTNRAAREMKERIRALLVERAGEEETSPLYARALSRFDRAAIHTIHGFCQTVLSTWPFESDVPFGQELDPEGGLETQEARRWLASGAPGVSKLLLTRAYDEAGSADALAESIAESLRSDAFPPGSVVIPSREQSLKFSEDLTESRKPNSSFQQAFDALVDGTWTVEAAKELIKAALGKNKRAPALQAALLHLQSCQGAQGLAEGASQLFSGPSHLHELLLAAWVAKNTSELGESAKQLSSEAEELAQVTDLLLLEFGEYLEIDPEGERPLHSLVDQYLLCSFQDVAQKEVAHRTEELKSTSGRWNYSDLIRRVAAKVAEPHSPLLTVIRERYQAALIDEFQDTDPLQWSMFHKIFVEAGSPLILIGDPKQSIYGFRGTGLQAYQSAKDSVPSQGQYRLDTNYRSCPELVGAVNRLFSPLFQRNAGGGSPVGFEAVKAGKTDAPELIFPGGNHPMEFISAESEEDAAHSIVSTIRQLLDYQNGGQWKHHNGTQTPVQASDMAILVRSAHQEEQMAQLLSAMGIPSLRIRSRSVFDQPVAQALSQVLQAMESPRDLVRWRRVLLGPFFQIAPDLLVKIQEQGALDDFVEEGARWNEELRRGRGTAVLESFFVFASQLGGWIRQWGREADAKRLEVPWPHRVLRQIGGEREWQDWRHLCELFQAQQAAGARDPGQLAQWLTSGGRRSTEGAADALRLADESPAVRILTMHASKGLQFPLVFLLGGFRKKERRQDGAAYRFDSQGTLVIDRLGLSKNREKHLAYSWEEDKRLWYVAFTRAISKLWVPRPCAGAPTLLDSFFAETLLPDFAKQAPGPPIHECLKTTPSEAQGLRERLEPCWSQWLQEQDSPITFSNQVQSLSPLGAPEFDEPRLAPLPPEFPGWRDPSTMSYSSLVRGAEGERTDDRDVDRHSETAIGSTPTENLLHPIPLLEDRGALFGTLMHALLEDEDFHEAVEDAESWQENPERDQRYADLSFRHFRPDWYKPRAIALKDMVRTTLRAPIPGLGPLCHLSPEEHRAEVEFLMEVPQGGALKAPGLDVALRRGFLTGFIDLLLCHQGKWWVVDWKTNVPAGAESQEDYDEATVQAMMEEHHYTLQYELYLLALCCQLSSRHQRPVDWESEVGGAAYLFLRGLQEEHSQGIYSAKPSLERMIELASAMGLEGVVA
ncbi:MAG: UvrD-helicase domain-containing protein [Spirochaetales bacterium]|nr:UvrD-helicase domain-containing protein [Spirochaetales bacterium]